MASKKVLTEHDWLHGDDAGKLLAFVRGRISVRKLRLFAVACCRRLWDQLDENGRRAAEVAEQYADGTASHEDLRLAWTKTTAWTAESLTCWNNIADESWPGHFKRFVTAQTLDDLRDIAGNPFRPVTVRPECLTWNDGIIVEVAQRIYDERAYERLPILADALEDAGCTDTDVLNHCRQGGEHVRGCFVLDLLLGRQ
jgi:hypothetical protein